MTRLFKFPKECIVFIPMSELIKVLIAGCGHMGSHHALAYHHMPAIEICGIVSNEGSNASDLPGPLRGYPFFADYFSALAETCPDAVSINTYPDTHAVYAQAALAAGHHVFVEKPLACNLDDAQAVVNAAERANRKLLVGYILRHHPVYRRLVFLARRLRGPFAMRMNLNKPSFGRNWEKHKKILTSLSPLVDSGVHYIDLMKQITGLSPTQIYAAGTRLWEGLSPGNYDYGQLTMTFEDGSVGWFESGWGPTAPKTGAVKEICTGRGSICLLEPGIPAPNTQTGESEFTLQSFLPGRPPSLEKHPRPRLETLCRLEQEFFLDAIINDKDLAGHHADALESLGTALAADQIIRLSAPRFTSATQRELSLKPF
jgi:predicted dehydrogenase